jgi:hypothetical protein
MTSILESKRKYYYKNTDKFKEKYQEQKDILKEKREMKKFSGFFILYNDENIEIYIGFSKNIKSRYYNIMKSLHNNTPFMNKFRNSTSWKYRVIMFYNEYSQQIYDKLILDYKDNILI